jgi:hypothetical protein
MYIALSYPQYAASLFAGNDLCRSIFAFGTTLFARPMYVNLSIEKGISVLGGVSILGIVSPSTIITCTSQITYANLQQDRDFSPLLLWGNVACSIKVCCLLNSTQESTYTLSRV